MYKILQQLLSAYVKIVFTTEALKDDVYSFKNCTEFLPCIYKELVSKTFYIYSYMLLICSSGHSKETISNTKFTTNYVDTNWNLE